MRAARLFFLAVLLAAACACSVNPVTGRTEFMLVSEQEELRLGDRMYPNAMWASLGGGGEYRDPALNEYLSGIVFDLHKASHRPELPVTFAVQNSSMPNAWAIPGHVVMTRGLLVNLASEAEFAFVMGHEIGHVSARHTARQLSYKMLQAAGVAAAGVALEDSQYAGGVLAAGALGSELLLLRFSRADELESDRLGVEYMAGVGYSPSAAVDAHKSLEEAVDGYMDDHGRHTPEGGFLSELLSTHPRTSVRVEEIEDMRASVEPGPLRGDGIRAERFRARLAAVARAHQVYRDYYDKAVAAYRDDFLDEADGLLDRAIRADATQAPFYVLKGYIRLKRDDRAGAEELFRTALAKDPAYQPAMRGLGTARYLAGAYGDAEATLSRALELFPDDLSSLFFLGMSEHRGGDHAGAIRHLGGYLDAVPGDPRVRYYLALSHEKVGYVEEAFDLYFQQVQAAPDTEEGKLAYERMMELRETVHEIEREKRLGKDPFISR